VPRGNSERRNRARKPCQLNSTFALATGGGRARGCGGCKSRGGAAAEADGRRLRCAATSQPSCGAAIHAS
jgi:hypothetical protein